MKVLPKMDPRKQVLAWWLKRHTVQRNAWIAARLYMGDISHISRAKRSVEIGKDRFLKKPRKDVETVRDSQD